MPSLYKYLPSQYVDDFIHQGAILFRSLSYFRDYEDAQIRGDEFEGTKLYRPQEGLQTTFTTTQQNVVLPHSFESAVNEEDVFVFCLSTVLSADLAKQFQTGTCVEILNQGRFIGGIRSAMQRRPSIKNKMLAHGRVKYYNPNEAPIVDWALPDRIAMSKLSFYIPQHEYRIAFAINDAFRVENTRLRLVPLGEERSAPRTKSHPNRLFKIGRIANLCKVHHFI